MNALTMNVLATSAMKKVQAVIPILMLCGLTACSSVEERRQATLDRAEYLLDLGDTPKALQVLDSFLSYDPRDPVIHHRMAEIHFDEGRPGQAVAILESIPGDVDLGVDSSDLLVRALVAGGHLRRATAILKRAEADSPAGEEREMVAETVEELLLALAEHGVPDRVKLPAHWWSRVVLLQLEKQRLPSAIRNLEKVTDAELRDSLAERIFAQGLSRQEVELFRPMKELTQPPWSAWKLLVRHRLLTGVGQEDEAAVVEKEFLRLHSNHPKRFDMLLMSSRRHARAGEVNRSLELAQEASALRPTRPEPLVEQALALKALDRRQDAEQALETALSLVPDFRPAKNLLKRWDRQKEKSSSGSTRLRLTVDSESTQ